MAFPIFLILSLVAQLAAGQTPGNTTEVHPKLDTFRCTVIGGCKKQANYIVVDSSQHPIHQATNNLDCGSWGNPPNATACPDAASCAKNCIIEGIPDYTTHGVTTSGTELRLQQRYRNTTISPRVYLLEENKEKYDMLYLTGSEFTFDVEMSKLPCGMNSALYLSEMLPDGGQSLSPHNKAGPYYGTGYCDAQCFVTPFINGVGNIAGRGSCCNELDIWEANSRATHIAPHVCNQTGVYECVGAECGSDGVCDKPGCGWNPNRVNVTDYYGRGDTFTVDTTRKFTVVSQFVADKYGDLKELHRLYVQDNHIIQSAVVNIDGPPKVNFINDEYCKATGADPFMRLGGMKGMGEAMSRGMVLAMSIWWDEGGNMAWLDQGDAGPCNATEGSPTSILKVEPYPEVTFSNIRIGEINSTFVLSSPYKRDSSSGLFRRETHAHRHLHQHQGRYSA
ncbi:concanavalin A-like lectin/glucanase domain-containing protein [Dactylonectria macrodidyma]|uniref:Glucanase n=1 Tax=Dactylonectria macrodidyma TaxID=307937 RepID=A0A9P9DVG0_9HYPO|nr:concanavalin A-like lectin/glucanase domain-containing protein [Dactylonectria macrodidyma]